MNSSMSSRERMLAAISGAEPDYVPCCFMTFAALREQCSDQFEFVARQIEMGLDTTMGLPVRPALRYRDVSEQGDLHGLPIRFAPEVEVKDWREEARDGRYPILHRQYVTPAGTLHTAVNKTEDWIQGDRVPLFDDFVIPRARERLIKGAEDLSALRHLLAMPTDEDVAAFREAAQPAKTLASKHDLLLVGEWGALADAACWLCGMEELVLMALEQPQTLKELFTIIGEWNRRRMEVILGEQVDLFIRRAWYETADFWSPALYERFILPELKRDVELAHAMGSKLAVISTSSYTPLLDLYLDSGMDVLLGLDPVQDPRVDFALTKQKVGGKICLWGGVNGFVHVERGMPDDVRGAVREAMRLLAPGGGFILSPIDNVTINQPHVWTNVEALLETWRQCR